MTTLRVLVADDEPLARQRLLDLLAPLPDVEVAGTAGSGREALALLEAQLQAGQPVDVAFLDVQMPGLTGLDVARAVGPERMPVTIFVTAYDQHALAAFELAALDYLLKPFEDARFHETLERARRLVRLQQVDELRGRLLTLLQQPQPARPPAQAAPAYLERITVEMRGQVRIVPVDRIDYFSADGAYVELHAGEDTYLLRERLQTLEERLDPQRFMRVHRSTIVQLDRVEALMVAAGGDYAVRLKGGRRLRVSRSRRDALVERLRGAGG